MGARIGIDTGGTFTDFVLFDDTGGTFRVTKVPSTPDDASLAIRDGLRRLEGAGGASQVVVGTTVATNAVLERRGPTVVFVTSARRRTPRGRRSPRSPCPCRTRFRRSGASTSGRRRRSPTRT